MLRLQEIRKQTDGLVFESRLDLAEELKARNPEILDVKEIVATGRARFEDGLFFLDYDLAYTITLASSRSMTPVDLAESYPVSEIFVEAGSESKKADWIEDDLLLVLEGEELDLAESVADNILLNIPLKVLTPEEEAGGDMPTGQDWQVMTEEEFAASQEEKKAANNPFSGLAGLFDED